MREIERERVNEREKETKKNLKGMKRRDSTNETNYISFQEKFCGDNETRPSN